MKMHTRAVHAGDRKKPPAELPVTVPVYTAASFIAPSVEDLDRIFEQPASGFCYGRYHNPTNSAFEELMADLESGYGALATSSGMSAVHVALATALTNKPKNVVAANALYGATVSLLLKLMEPFGVTVRFVDVGDLDAVRTAVAEGKPGCVLLETVSNPLLRVPDVGAIAQIAHAAGASLIVDNTFATPLLVRPLELGADFVVHSATKFLAGHGDVLGGVAVTTRECFDAMRMLSRAYGPVLGPFESYLAMRGVKTFPLRMERQCANARIVAEWLRASGAVERVYYPDDPSHPDSKAIGKLFAPGLFGAMVSFELRDARREQVFRFMNRLKTIVCATSLGDVHSLMLYPFMSSHRDTPPHIREAMGIRENLVRLSCGIEAVEDISGDLEQALAV